MKKSQMMVVINDTIETSWESWSIIRNETWSNYKELTITINCNFQGDRLYDELVKLSHRRGITFKFNSEMVFKGDIEEFSTQSKGVLGVDVTMKLSLRKYH